MTFDFDIVVIGAGPAGMSAAVAAARDGKRVALIDENPDAGGQIWRTDVQSKSSAKKYRKSLNVMFGRSTAFHLSKCRVVDIACEHVLRVLMEGGESARVVDVRWKKLILATGARERFIPFPGWTLPGVFGAGGLQALVKTGCSVEGKRVVVAGSGPLLLPVAAYLRERGAKIIAITEQTCTSRLVWFAMSLLLRPRKIVQGGLLRWKLRGVPYLTNSWPIEAIGDGKLEGVRISNGDSSWVEPVDCLACGFHLLPNIELAMLLGCKVKDGHVVVNSELETSVDDVFSVGELNGIAGLDAALAEGELAGSLAAGRLPDTSVRVRAKHERAFGVALDNAFALRPELRSLSSPETIICRCEDIPLRDISERHSWADAKLHTRCGMGSCQGRVCGGAVEFLFGWRPTSARPPVFPTPMKAFGSQAESQFTTNPQKEFS